MLDVATGTGMVAAELLARADCSVVRSTRARRCWRGPARLRGRARRRVELIEGQAESLPFADASFDALTFTYLLRYVDDPAATVAKLARIVSARWARRLAGVRRAAVGTGAGGVAAVHGGGAAHAGRLASREWEQVGRFLGPSIRGFYARHPLERIVGYWRAGGAATTCACAA